MEYLQYLTDNSVINSIADVLNLIINGIPSIPFNAEEVKAEIARVLNLIINGIPSILSVNSLSQD